MTKWLIFLAVVQALPLSAAPPNVVFLLIDDMGYADLSCYGEKRVHTDHIDQLAREGIRFTQFYVNAPICSPSRTAFTTGQYPARWKITSYLAKRADDAKRGCADWLDPKAPTLARSLKAAGYTTGHFGKWHMGGQRDVGDAPLITEYGFDKTLTTFEGLGDRVLPILDSFDGKPARKFELGLMSERLGRGKITWADRSRETSYFVNAALDFVKHAEATGTPFFVDLWPDDVHSPFFPPKALRGDGSKKELYLGVVQATDDQVAPLLDYIRNSPTLRDNTLIIVASDNGPEPGAGSAGPFRGEKGNLYEGGVREPFIVWAPALIDKAAAGTTNEKTVVAAVDFLPSIQTITGVHRRDDQLEDGQDMSKSLLGKEQAIRTKPLFWIRPPDRRGPNPKKNPWPDLSVRDGDWKLLINEDGSRPQLYDLGNDIGETKNLATDKPEIVARLKEMLMKWRATLPVTLPKVTADLRGPS